MDFLISSSAKTMELALNGLSMRHKLLSANVANSDTQDYKRIDVSFENQLAKIVQDNNEMQKIKEAYSASLMQSPNLNGIVLDSNLTRLNALKDSYKDFKPEVITDNVSAAVKNGNNVQIEYEMSELTKNGMKYTAIAQRLAKKYQGLSDLIKSAGA